MNIVVRNAKNLKAIVFLVDLYYGIKYYQEYIIEKRVSNFHIPYQK